MAALRFLGKHFNMPGPVREGDSFTESPSEFLVGQKVAGSLPGALDKDGVFLAWQHLLTARNQTMTKGQRVELLRLLTGSRIPVKPILVATRGEGFLHRDGESDVVPARIIAGHKSMSIVAVHGKGADSALKMRAVKEAQSAGAQVVAIDAFGTGSSAAAPRGRHGDHLVFHYSDDANRVQDILTAASWLAGQAVTSGQGAVPVTLHCGGGGESWCRLAAAVSPIALTVHAEGDHAAEPNIPGLWAAGYTAAAR